MHKFSVSLFVLFVIFFSQAQAKSIASKDKTDKVSSYFMGQILSGEVEAAYSLLSAYAGIDLEQFIERGKKVSTDMKQLEKSAGKPLSFDLLETQSVGEHFYKITYLLKYETIALIWNINYYQPDKGWKLVDVSFNGDINALFK
ncbi:MAG: hypothetical protein ACI9T7_001193 [Oleiphilaceae bacterium]